MLSLQRSALQTQPRPDRLELALWPLTHLGHSLAWSLCLLRPPHLSCPHTPWVSIPPVTDGPRCPPPPLQEFFNNFMGDPTVKIPWVRTSLCGPSVLVMEWIDGIRCTNPDAIRQRLDVDEFIRCGVVSGLRQLLEFGLFHGDPHPGNIFALADGRIA